MSLINDVLRDIGKKRNNIPDAQQQNIADLFVPKNSNAYQIYSLLAIILLSALLIGGGIWYWYRQSLQQAHTKQVHVKQTTTSQSQQYMDEMSPHPYMQKTKLPSTHKQILKKAYQQALITAQQGNIQQAIFQLKKLVIANPNEPVIREHLVALLIQHQQMKEAYKWLMPGYRKFAHYAPFVELQARIFLTEGKVARALSTLQTVSPVFTREPRYYALLAEAQRRAGNENVAEKIYQKLLKYDPDNSYWWLGLGISYDQAGNNNLAIQAYNKALHTDHLTFALQNYAQTRIEHLGG